MGFGVGRFEGAVSYLPRDIYSKLRAIFPSARRRASHRIASPEVAVWLEEAQTSSSSSSIEMIFFSSNSQAISLISLEKVQDKT